MNKKVIIAIIVVIILAVIAGVFFFINSNKVELNLEELNTTISGMEPFSKMTTATIDSDVLSALYEIEPEEYEEVIGSMPMINVQASMYLVIKAKSDTLETVKQKVDAYAQKQETTWSTYLPEQYDLVKARRSGTVGNYVYLIIAENASEIEALINK